MNLTEKTFSGHLVGKGGLPPPGEVATIRVDEAFTQDASGTMCLFQLEAMDVILKMLSIKGVKGGKGKVLEYTGPGVAGLSLTERASKGGSTNRFSVPKTPWTWHVGIRGVA